jgi:formylglycine-generating enzyme required for sulfatase activity
MKRSLKHLHVQGRWREEMGHAHILLGIRMMSTFCSMSMRSILIMICYFAFFGCNRNLMTSIGQKNLGPIASETLSVPHGLALPIVLKSIPAGTFTIGSDSSADYDAYPPHQVTLSTFKIQETDVTQEQYLAVMGTNPSNFDTGMGALLRPVETVSWYDAVRFCNALSKLSGLDSVYEATTWAADFTKNGFRLPTEAQWEYACRAGSITEYWWGPDTNGMGARSWWYYNSNGTTHPVAAKLANAYGLYDMKGNVFNWCNDWYESYTAGEVIDPIGPATGTLRVSRGAAWEDNLGFYGLGLFRSAYRSPGDFPSNKNQDIGFRVALPE